MTLLRFRVANHRSIRDEQTLSLVATPRRGQPKPKSGEIPPTVRVVGIYGANASGKSNVLSALAYMLWCIRDSQTRWRPDRGVPRQPFRLEEGGTSRSSFYELDFVHRQTRYSYGFELDDEQVLGEWLFSFPEGRPRRLFERSGPDEYKFGRSLKGETARIAKLTRANSLYLSSAANNDHPLLGDLHRWLTDHIKLARQIDFDQQVRTQYTQQLLRDTKLADLVRRLLQAADLGISDVKLRHRPLSEDALRLLSAAGRELLSKEDIRELETVIQFVHTGTHGTRTFDFGEESAGTQVWFSLVGPLLNALLHRSVLLVDEVDSSLHPHLSSTIIRMFKDETINPHRSQLIFASHDTTLLGSLLDDGLLDRDEVWFTEKDETGATSLYSLAEFTPRRDENIERGYLQGRYGAVPYLSFDRIRSIFQQLRAESDESSTQPSESAPQDGDPQPEGQIAGRL
ncbi:ATP-binding protein [Thermomonospora sp. CIF 1]|uniref:AAA family ATPase n=1 Tax=Thermomonospora sp. CIF 1 TaxID=1916083 RepID=UPI000A44949C|nr:ATP-binding protein [Thermomonospora sp. CIF 1]PKK15165.1 MAG: hypothetical protein BUE48_006315 [Thermomonospora sp. CIF 1]